MEVYGLDVTIAHEVPIRCSNEICGEYKRALEVEKEKTKLLQEQLLQMQEKIITLQDKLLNQI